MLRKVVFLDVFERRLFGDFEVVDANASEEEEASVERISGPTVWIGDPEANARAIKTRVWDIFSKCLMAMVSLLFSLLKGRGLRSGFKLGFRRA